MDNRIQRDWTPRLAVAIAAAVRELAANIRATPVALFLIDCFPWHGLTQLSILTAAEAEVDPSLVDPAEAAAWRHFDFAAGFAAWDGVRDLGREMADAYSAASDIDRTPIAEDYIKACAAAAASMEVRQALTLLKRDPRFKISVHHPDNGRELYVQ